VTQGQYANQPNTLAVVALMDYTKSVIAALKKQNVPA